MAGWSVTSLPNRDPMHLRSSVLLAALLLQSAGQAADLTARASLFGAAGRGAQGDLGNGEGVLASDQQSLRLMLDDAQDKAEWSLHLRAARRHGVGVPAARAHSSALFRYRALSGDWLDTRGRNSATAIGYELDRAVYVRRFRGLALAVGRQPVDWGSGRFWQPLNVFGAFAPTDLDTDFKPGIDAVALDWFPTAFSSLAAVVAASPREQPQIESSAAVRYRRQVGQLAELSLLAGRVIGNRVLGASFESEWAGIGWRIEGLRQILKGPAEDGYFWIAGADYQLDDGTLLVAEFHDNSRGASRRSELAGRRFDPLVAAGLQQHLGRRVVGFAAQRDITPLLNGSYKLFISVLRNDDDARDTSSLHQLSLVYSLSNESDLLLSLLYATGKGLAASGDPRSEFGHLPASVSLRWRRYF